MARTNAVLPVGGKRTAFIDEDVQLAIAAAPPPLQIAAPVVMTLGAAKYVVGSKFQPVFSIRITYKNIG
jgi:hypothetical protein